MQTAVESSTDHHADQVTAVRVGKWDWQNCILSRHGPYILTKGRKKPHVRLLACTIFKHMDKNGTAFPSQDLIAEESGISIRTVRRWLNVLEHDGYIKRMKINKGESRGWRVTKYEAMAPTTVLANVQRDADEKKGKRQNRKANQWPHEVDDGVANARPVHANDHGEPSVALERPTPVNDRPTSTVDGPSGAIERPLDGLLTGVLNPVSEPGLRTVPKPASALGNSLWNPETQSKRRRNGEFEAINDAIAEVIAACASTGRPLTTRDLDSIARMTDVTRSQAEESIRQLLERKRIVLDGNILLPVIDGAAATG